MLIREFRGKDLEAVLNLYSDYKDWEKPQSDMIPSDGFVAEEDGEIIACGFIYLPTSSGMSFLEWVAAKKSYRKDDRDDVILSIIEELKELARVRGFRYVYAFLQHDKLIEKYEKKGFLKDPNKGHELIHIIQ